MFDINDNVIWSIDKIPTQFTKNLGSGPFKVIGEFDGRVSIEYVIPFKKMKKTGRKIGTALVSSRLLKKA